MSKKNQCDILIITKCGSQIGTGHLKRSIELQKYLTKENLKCEIWINKSPESIEIINNLPKNSNIKYIKKIYFQVQEYKKYKIIIFDIAWNDAWLDSNINQLKKLIEKLDNSNIRVVNIGKPKIETLSFRSFIDIYPDGTKIKVSGNISPRFVSLREEFSNSKSKLIVPFNGCIFLSMGGTDPFSMLEKTIEQLVKCKEVKHLKILLSNNKIDLSKIKKSLTKNKKTAVFLKNLSAKEIIRNMKKSDFVVSAFGTSAFEAMSIGVPVIAMTHYSHQDNSAKWFADLKAIEYLGCAETGINWSKLKSKIKYLFNNQKVCADMSSRANSYIDGKGNQRIIALLKEIYKETFFNLDHLFVFAHPGTEALVASGIITKLVNAGKNVGIVVMGDGISSRIKNFNKKNNISNLHTDLEKSFEKSCKILGVKVKYFFRYPDNQFDNEPLLSFVKSIEILLKRHKPSCVWTHLENGINVDQKITNKAVMIASRPISGSKISKVIGFKSPGSTDWSFSVNGNIEENWFEEIDFKSEKRIQSYRCYSDINYFKHKIHSLKHINSQLKFNGKKIGVNAAESFYLIRNIIGRS